MTHILQSQTSNSHSPWTQHRPCNLPDYLGLCTNNSEVPLSDHTFLTYFLIYDLIRTSGSLPPSDFSPSMFPFFLSVLYHSAPTASSEPSLARAINKLHVANYKRDFPRSLAACVSTGPSPVTISSCRDVCSSAS